MFSDKYSFSFSFSSHRNSKKIVKNWCYFRSLYKIKQFQKFKTVIYQDLPTPRAPTPRTLQNFGKMGLAPLQPLEKFKFYLGISSLIHLGWWFLNRNWSQKCQNCSNFGPLFVFFSSNFLVHNVLWLFNIVLYYSCFISIRYTQMSMRLLSKTATPWKDFTGFNEFSKSARNHCVLWSLH